MVIVLILCASAFYNVTVHLFLAHQQKQLSVWNMRNVMLSGGKSAQLLIELWL